MIIIVSLSHQKGEIEETVTTQTASRSTEFKYSKKITIIVAGTTRCQKPLSQEPAGSSNFDLGRLAAGQADLTESWWCWWSIPTVTLYSEG
jgi:hypothetical protein